MSTNGALTTLLNAPGAAGTTFEVAANTGAWFVAGPAIVYRAGTTVFSKTNLEAVTLSAPVGDAITVTRAQQGHAALTLAAGDFLVQSITALDWDTLKALVASQGSTLAGVTVTGTPAAGKAVVAVSASAAQWTDVATQAELDAFTVSASGTYVPLTGRRANVRRLLDQLLPPDSQPFALTSDAPTVTVSTAATVTAGGRQATAISGEVTEVGSRGTWNAASGRLPVSQNSGLDFVYTGQALEVMLFAGFTGNHPIWVFVDGQPVTAAPDTTSVGSLTINTNYFVKLAWGAVKRRRVEVFMPLNGGSWVSVVCGPQDIIEPSPRKPVVAWVGDSFYAGSAASGALSSASMMASRLLGVESASMSFGGTGYVTAGAFSAYGSAGRVASVASFNPDLIVMQGSLNDDGGAGIQAAATAALDAYSAACPGASIIVLGPQPSNATSTLSANRQANIAAVKAAAVAHSAVIGWHDMVGTAAGLPSAAATSQTYPDGTLVSRVGSVFQVKNGGTSFSNGANLPPTDRRFALKTWVYFGTGQVGTTVGDGNRDTLLHSDGVHPTDAASIALAVRTATAIRGDLATYVTTGAVTVD